MEVDELRVRFGALAAVDGASFDVEGGEVVALLGPNGAGKTTTVRALEGYQAPTDGRVRVLGLDPVADRRALLPRLGAMPQSSRLYSPSAPSEALRLFAAYYPEPDDPEALLRRVGLGDRARTAWRRLSGGEQQRLSLALALVGRPEVVLLDEPTAGVDVEGRRLVRELVAGLRARGVAVLVTTHELDEAERMADRVVIVDRGEVVAAGRPDELARLAGPSQLRFAAPPGLPATELAVLLGGPVREERPGEYLAEVEPAPGTVAALAGWLAERDVHLGDLRAGRQRLEDVFLRLTGEGRGAR
ncbi:MAG: ATP-binding cassette domain-containing protein [Acidimicrobiia bacterium]|nr:ATP-binding cassette domain-containing protein [Acidimicrobiia bacterium]